MSEYVVDGDRWVQTQPALQECWWRRYPNMEVGGFSRRARTAKGGCDKVYNYSLSVSGRIIKD